MNESFFYKQFAEKIRQATPPPDFSEADWEKLSQQLDQDQRRKWRIVPLWWLGALSALLVFSNLAWWWTWGQTRASEEKRLDALETRAEQAFNRLDTVVQTHVVVRYDTVYQRVVRTVPQYLSVKGRKAETGIGGVLLPPISNQPLPDAGMQSPLNQTSAPTAVGAAALPNNSDNKPERLWESGTMLPTTAPGLLHLPVGRLTMPPIIVMHQADRSESTLFPMVPRFFRLGAGGGWMTPVADALYRRGGFTTMISAEVGFSEQLAMHLDGGFSGVTFRCERLDPELGFPKIDAPGGYDLGYYELREGFKPIYHLGVGMRYFLLPRYRVHPMIGLGYQAQFHGTYEMNAEFVDKQNGRIEYEEVYVPTSRTPISMGSAEAGFRFRINSRLSGQVGASYLLKLNARQPGLPAYWGLNSLLYYEF